MRKFRLTITGIVVLVLIFCALQVSAVTYRNDGSSAVILKNKQGSQEVLMPGNQLETYYYNDNAGLTKISDTPYWSRVLSRETVIATSSGADASIDLETDYVILFKLTGTITVYLQSDANTPPVLKDWTEDDFTIQIPVKGRCDNMVIKGTGTCEVVQYRDEN